MMMGGGESGATVSVAAPAAMPGANMMGTTQNARDMEEAMDIVMDGDGIKTSGDVRPLAEGERLIVKNGTLSLVVDDVTASIDRIKTYTEAHDGFVVTSNVQKRGVAPVGTITVRIPSESFDEGFAEFETYGEVEERRTDGRDITEEYVDLDAQLKNLRATEQQFLNILNRATKVEDILAVQRELTWVRQSIERIEGRMKYLRESADLSSITVHLSTDPSALPILEQQNQWRPLGVLKDAARSFVEFGQAVVNFIIWLIIFIPWFLLLALIVRGVMYARKKYTK